MFALVCFCAVGCTRLIDRHASSAVSYTTQPPIDSSIDERAQNLNSRGVRAYEAGNLPKAEQLFREALEIDVNFGPAHNNLGQVYLDRHQLYLAAWEFEYAGNLMPELVEPLVNQGLAYETGERIDRAAEIYHEAYNRHPNHPSVIASLARARIKQEGDPDEIRFLLDELIMHDGRIEWVQWAKELRATRYRGLCEEYEVSRESFSPEEPSYGYREDVPLRDQLLPLEQPSSPSSIEPRRLIPTELEELRPPNDDLLSPPVNIEPTPPLIDRSSMLDQRMPKRLPSASDALGSGDVLLMPSPGSNGGVEQVSFDAPSLTAPGIKP